MLVGWLAASLCSALCVGVAVALVSRPRGVTDDIEKLCREREWLRRRRRFAEADEIKKILVANSITVSDNPDGSFEWIREEPPPTFPDILALAKSCRDSPCSSHRNVAEENAEAALATIRHERWVARRNLPGRKAADAAFAFAMGGCDNDALFEELADCALGELDRTGSGRRHVAERLAAAALRSDHPIFLKTAQEFAVHHVNSYFSRRASIWRWRFVKRAGFVPRPVDQMFSAPQFEDASLPLVIDVGCGLGQSALGLAECLGKRKYNVLGVDATPECVRAASSVARRLNSSARFVHGDALDSLRWARDDYEGPVSLTLIQFPSPFSLEDPTVTVRGEQFMLTDTLLELLKGVGGQLYVTSNVEDVAVRALELCSKHLNSTDRLRDDVVSDIATIATQSAENDEQQLFPPLFERARVPRREERWASSSQNNPRAVGFPWLEESPFPAIAWTETEVAFIDQAQPIHRLLFDTRH